MNLGSMIFNFLLINKKILFSVPTRVELVFKD